MSLRWITGVADKPELVFLPCCAMFALTASQLLRLITLRNRAIQTKEVPIKYYKLYNGAGEPDCIAKVTDNVTNLFEAPPLMYIAAIIYFQLKAVTPNVAAAFWLYVLLRTLHTLVHTGSNNVFHRFLTYAGSTITLFGLWGNLAYKIAS